MPIDIYTESCELCKLFDLSGEVFRCPFFDGLIEIWRDCERLKTFASSDSKLLQIFLAVPKVPDAKILPTIGHVNQMKKMPGVQLQKKLFW